MKNKIAYHFVGDKLRDGRPVPKDGEWLEHFGRIEICTSGLHASFDAFDALQYAPGNTLCIVEVDCICDTSADKFVCRKRKIVKRVNSEELLRKFAMDRALSVIDKWDAPPIVVEYLKTGNESLRAAAWAAARGAARDAARAAAWAAARGAARDAAWSAAWDAARAAAWAAAWSAAWDAARAAAWAAARDAAWAAARGAARDAARAAAWAAARDADRAAAWSAAWDAARKVFNEMVKKAFDKISY